MTIHVDVIDEGHGPAVVLVPSSVSGNRQWRALVAELAPQFRVLAINLYGYGTTPAWSGQRPQRLTDQAALVHAALAGIDGPVALVGHSFGGAVAMRAACELGDRVRGLVLLEPIPFMLLHHAGRAEAFAEACSLRDAVQERGRAGRWLEIAERFADYYVGDGAWAAMPPPRRAAFAAALPPNIHEWDAATDLQLRAADLTDTPAPTMLVLDPATRRPIRELADVLGTERPDWTIRPLPGAGHMTPLLRPELTNSVIVPFLVDHHGTATPPSAQEPTTLS